MADIDLREQINKFLARDDLKYNSLRAYRVDLRYFHEFFVGERHEFQTLSKAHLLEWLRDMPARVSQRRASNIRCFLMWLAERTDLELLPEWFMPWRFSGVTPQKLDKPPVDLHTSDLDKIWGSEIDLSQKALISVILDTGCTLEEVAQLKWSGIDFGKISNVVIGDAGEQRINTLSERTTRYLREMQSVGEYIFQKKRSVEPLGADMMSMILRRSLQKIFLEREITPTSLQEIARRQIRETHGILYARDSIGKKNSYSLIRPDNEVYNSIDYKGYLKGIHQKAFSY